MSNASFISTGDHAAALTAIQVDFPTAFFNSHPLGGNQLITVKDCDNKTLRASKAIRSLLRSKAGRIYPSR